MSERRTTPPRWTPPAHAGVLLLLIVLGALPVAAVRAEQAGGVDGTARNVAGNLAAGDDHTCAIVNGWAVRCWGRNFAGQLGNGNTADVGDDETPADVGEVDLGLGHRALAIAAGRAHTCTIGNRSGPVARTVDGGSVRCWGDGTYGQLGYGDDTAIGDDETPDTAGEVDLGAGRRALAIAAGGDHTCAVLDDDSARCWGEADWGALGYGNTDDVGDDETPGSVNAIDFGAGRTVTAITTDVYHSCAILDDGSVRCWGLGQEGQLGYGDTDDVGDDETPGSVGGVDLGAGRTAVAISAGQYHTCAILDDGSVRCWGDASDGQLGYGNQTDIGDNESPASVGPVDLGAGRTAVGITTGDDHSCAVLDDRTVRCWGLGFRGQLGYGNTNDIGDDESPATAGAVMVGADAWAITAGAEHTCVVLEDGVVACWGRGDGGVLGYGNEDTIGNSTTPDTAGRLRLGGRIEFTNTGGGGTGGGGPPQPPVTPIPFLVPLDPARLLDTRDSATIDGAFRNLGPLPGGNTIEVQIAGRGGVPATDVDAAVLNVGALTPQGEGFLTIYPCGALPNASSLNYTTGDNIPNEIIAKLSPTGTVCIYTYATTGLITDVAGYIPTT